MQTSFSGVEVMPFLPEDAMNVEIPEEDLEISFSRAGGKGGQNVNTVRCTGFLNNFDFIFCLYDFLILFTPS
jgi:protein subunit release factor A